MDELLHNAIHLQSLDSSEWVAARQLIDAHLGAGYFDSVNVSGPSGIWIGAFAHGHLIGVARAAVMPLARLPIDAKTRQRVFSAETQEVGVLKTLVVAPTARGRGVGRRLTRERLKWLAERVADVVTISWCESGPAATAVLAKCGFREMGQLVAPFAGESLAHGVVCPVCGSPPCACAGVLFWRSLP